MKHVFVAIFSSLSSVLWLLGHMSGIIPEFSPPLGALLGALGAITSAIAGFSASQRSRRTLFVVTFLVGLAGFIGGIWLMFTLPGP